MGLFFFASFCFASGFVFFSYVFGFILCTVLFLARVFFFALGFVCFFAGGFCVFLQAVCFFFLQGVLCFCVKELFSKMVLYLSSFGVCVFFRKGLCFLGWKVFFPVMVCFHLKWCFFISKGVFLCSKGGFFFSRVFFSKIFSEFFFLFCFRQGSFFSKVFQRKFFSCKNITSKRVFFQKSLLTKFFFRKKVFFF